MKMQGWLLFIIVFVALSLLGIFIVKLSLRLARGFSSKTKTRLDDYAIRSLSIPLQLSAVIIAAHISLHFVSIKPSFAKVIQDTLFVLIVLLVVLAINNLFKSIIQWLHETSANKEFVRRFSPILEIGEKLFVWTAGLMIVMKKFNYDISSLVVSLGVGSLAIGLAAQDTLSNIIAGLTILLDQPFKVGDRIKLETGEFGDVLEIGLRSTKIKTLENYVLVIPNSLLVKSKVLNFYLPESRTVGRVSVGVSYGEDPEKVRRVLVKSALEVEEVLRQPEPSAFFTEFGDFSLNFLLVFHVDDPRKVFSAADKIRDRILENFRREGIDIPFPIQTIYLRRENESQN